jgi:tetratricopeptide (TPR) repeat protein
MADPKARLSLRVDNLASALEQKLDNEAGILDLLVAALARGQANDALWAQLHASAQRDDRLAELAFAYERLSRDKKLKSLPAPAQATVLGHAGVFFADVFGDSDGAEGYLERALTLAPGDVPAFDKYEKILAGKRDLRRLGELYASSAPHRGDKGEQLRVLRRGAEMVEGDPERALRLNQEILRLDPTDARAKGALAALYEKTGRIAELAKLLEQSLGPDQPEDEARATRLKLLALYAGPLGEIERTLPHVEEVLRFDPTHEAARRVAEELLGHKALTPRVAAALARAHEESGEPGEAARLLGVEIEAQRGPKKLEAQKRLARLTLEQLGDLEKTFALDEIIVPLDPTDHDVRTRFVKLASALDKQLEATRTLTRAATATRDPAVRARIGVEMGDLYRELGDLKKARGTYQSVLDAATDEVATLRAARALRVICLDPRDPRGLTAVLARLAEIEPEEDARLDAMAELGAIAETELGEPAAAIAAHERLLGTRMEGDALQALARLYEATGAFAALVGVLDRLVALERDPRRAQELTFFAADLRAVKLPDRTAALEAWRAYATRYGVSREALARLIPLLEHERRWEELAAALGAEIDLAPTAERAVLLSRLGQLRLARLGDARGALDAHREALALDPSERGSRVAVDRMLSAGDLRLAAADVLEPIARMEGSAPALVRVLEARAALLDDPRERLAALEEAATLAHAGLRDPRRAVDLAARGLGEALASARDAVPGWIDRVEQLSAGGDEARRAATLRDALGDRVIEDDALALLARRAGEALVASGDVTGALAVFRRALAYEPSSPELLARVDALLREQGSPEERLALYRSALEQADVASAGARRRGLLHAIGNIERRDLGSPAAAIATFRRALAEDASDQVAFEALLEVYESTGAWDDLYGALVEALARAVDGARAALLLRLAEVAAARGWLDRAAGHYAEIVAADGPLGEDVLAAAERVARERDDTKLLRAVLERRVAGAIDPLDEATWLTRLGDLLADRIGDGAAAADAFRRAARAAQDAGETARAGALHERVLLVRPDDRPAAERLLEIHREAEAWSRLPAVYAVLLRTAPSAAEATRTLLAFEAPALRAGAAERFLAEADTLLRRGEALPPEATASVRSARARVLGQDPARFAEAAAAYRVLLEAGDDESGAEARAFDALLATRGAEAVAERRWLFGHRAARAVEGAKIAVLMAWAEAEEGALGDPAAAGLLYEQIGAIDPQNDDALAARARLLLAQGDLEGAAAVIGQRRALSEGAARAALDLELATLLLDRLDRPEEALDALAAALDESPQDAAALRLVERALAAAARPEARRRAAELYERAADAAEDPATFAARMDVLLATSPEDPQLRGARRGWFERVLERPGLAPERALAVALQAAGELPQEPALWERAEVLAREMRAPETLADAYRRALGVAGRGQPAPAADRPPALAGQDAEVVEEIGRRAVEYHEEWFEEPEVVAALLRRVVELAPGSTWAFERLKLLYNLAERWDDLFALYDDAIVRAADGETRRELLEDAALAAKDLVSDSERAMRYYEQLLALRPDARVRSALERLYERHGRHRALIALHAADLPGLEGEAAQKLRARLAGLWLDGLGEAEPAVGMIEQMLDAEPERTDAFELLERVMARTAAAPPEAREARRRAAARLKERYRAAGRADDLVRMLEIDLDAAATPAERAERLQAIVRLRLDQLGDEAGAFEGVAALVTLEPHVAEHRAELGRLAKKLGRSARVAEVLAAAAAHAEGATQLDLLAQAADVYRVELGEPERAIQVYKTILSVAPERHPTLLAAARALDGLLARAGRDAERGDVLERIAELDPEPAARRAARAELSRFAVEAGDAERAARVFRAALAEDPADAEAEEGLARALEESGRWAELVEVLARRAARADDERGREDRVRVARLLEDPLGDGARAIETWLDVRRIFGADDESADALAALLERAGRFDELVALLEGEATGTPDAARSAELWRKIGDLHRAETGNLEEALAAYDLALEQRPSDPGARRGLEALLGALDPAAAATRRTLSAAVASLSRVYAAADDFTAMIAMLEPRLAVAGAEADRVSILNETATLLERRAGDPGRAFDAIFRAFTLAPSESLSAKLIRLADAAQRWGDVAEALAAGLGARADVPRPVARELFWRVATWQRDARGDAAAAEAALEQALALDPSSATILAALADVQRRAPGRALVTTLLRLAEAEGGRLDRYREAVEVAEGPVGDAALAKMLAEKLLDAAAARWSEDVAGGFASASEAAAWALEAMARLVHDEGPQAVADLFLRGARLPFDAGERRRLRLRAAELSGADATIGIYQELFEEDPRDELVSARLDAIYRDLGRLPALVALRARQIAVAPSDERRAELRLDLAALLAESGDREGAIATLRENLAATPPHVPSVRKLAELYEAGGHDAELVALCEDRAAAAEAAKDASVAMALWVKAAELAEARLGDAARAIADHRRAARLGATDSDAALARLLSARGDHAAAAEVLARICARTPPESLAEPVIQLVDALRAAGKPAAARAELERAVRVARGGAALRDRLAALYRETGEWGALASLVAEDAARLPDRAARAAKLREAAELYLARQRDPASAIPLFQQAAELSPDDGGIRLRLAAALRGVGDHEGAATALREVITAYGGRRPKERALVHFELAQIALAKGDRARALGELDAALRIDPAHPEILLSLAKLSMEEGQLDRAARTYRSLLLVVRRSRGDEAPGEEGVSRAEVLFELSEIARLRGETERAAEQLDSAFEAARESDTERERLLDALRARKRYDVLARALEGRLAGASGAAGAAILGELAALYESHLGRPAEALDAQLSALSLAPPSAEALTRALELARRAGAVERYVAALGKLVEAETDPSRSIDLLVALGQVLERDAADDARAAAAYLRAEEALAQHASDLPEGLGEARLPEIWRALEGAYERLGDVAAEEALLGRRLAAASPDTAPAEIADALYRMAALKLRRPDAEDDGLATLDRAFELEPDADRAEALLRAALAAGASGVAVGRALERIARRTGRERALVDALVLISGLDAEVTHVSDAEGRFDPIREAVEVAERLDDAALVESLLRRVLARAPIEGDAPLAWALVALAGHRAGAGDLAEAADLKERAARGAAPDRERALLLEVAGMASGSLGDLGRAARLFEELRAREPAEREIWQPLADVYRRLGDRARLAALLEETAPLLEGAAERGRLRLERAKMAVDEDQNKAIVLLQEVLEEDPSEAEAAAVLAALLEKLGRRDELAELIRRQLEAAKDREDRPAIVQLSLRLGALLEQQWDEQGALDAYHAALDWDPKSREVLRQIVRLGMARDDSMALGDALDQLLVVEDGEDAVELALRLAEIRGKHGDAEGAARALEQGWATNPGDARLKQELVRRYTASGAFRELAALHVREAETEADPGLRVEGLRRAAALLREQAGDPAAAAEVLETALHLEPSNRDVLVALVEAHTAVGEHARAVEAIGRALAVDASDAWLYRARASLHEELGRDQAALLDLEQAYEKSGGGYAGELVDALEKAAAACATRGTTEARASERGLRLRLAEVLTRAGEVERARAELTELTRTDGRDRGALRALAVLEEAAEGWDAASAIYRRLLALEDGEALVETALRLADACAKGDRLGDARGALERAKRVAPDSAAVREKLRAVYNVTGAARELAGLILEDAARASDVAGRFAHLVHAGRLLLAEGDAAQSASVFEEAKALRPEDGETTLLLADAYALAGRAVEARTILEAAVVALKGRRSKPVAAIHRRLARLDLADGDRSAALGALTRAFDSDPQNGQLAMELGSLAVEFDEHELATRAFRAVTLMKSAAAGSTEGVTTQLRALAYYHLGRMAYMQGDRRKARLMIDKSVADDPGLDAARALLEQLRAT